MRGTSTHWSLVFIALVAGCGDDLIEVDIATVTKGSIEASFSAEAYVKTRSVELTPRIAATVTEILVEEGDSVAFGDTVVKLYSADLQAQLTKAERDFDLAETRIEQASATIELARTQVEAEKRRAQAVLESYKAMYDRLVAGARPQEIAKAESEVDRAQAAVDEALDAFDRASKLFSEGAVSRARYEQAELTLKTSQAIHRAAVETVDLLNSGPTPEDVRAAIAEVEAAQASLEAANAREGEVEIRQHDYKLAVAALASVEQQTVLAQLALEDAVIKAPFSGVIGHLHVEVGDLVSPQRPVASFVEQDGMEIEAEIGDQDVAKVTIGQEVQLTSASYPGQTFNGTVVRIAHEAVQKPDTLIRTRIVRATIDPDEESRRLLKSGMEVDVQGRGVVAQQVLTIPSDALVTEDSKNFVWLLAEAKVTKREVEVGTYTFELTEIVTGLDEGDTVVLAPKDELSEGKTVTTK